MTTNVRFKELTSSLENMIKIMNFCKKGKERKTIPFLLLKSLETSTLIYNGCRN